MPGLQEQGVITKAGGPRRMNFMGEVALENDIVLCGCSTPPKLVADLHHTMTYDDEAASLVSASSAAFKSDQISAGSVIPANSLQNLITAGAIKQKIFKNLEHGPLTSLDAIVLHRTGGATATGTLAGYENKQSDGAHFLIDKDGTIYQTANIDKRTQHVGKILSRGDVDGTLSTSDAAQIKAINQKKISFSQKNVEINLLEAKKDYPQRYPNNSDSIGIEVVGNYNKTAKAYEPATAAQLASVRTLVEALKTSYNLTNKDIYYHGVISHKDDAHTEGTGLGY
jgi:hypothetical protein